VLPRFELVHRSRPVALIAEERRTGFVAPFAAVEAELGTHDLAGRVGCGFTAGGVRLEGWYDGGRRLAGLDVTDARGLTTHHRSRRHGRPPTPPDALATTLTGVWLTVLTRHDGEWTVRGRVDLRPFAEPRSPELLAELTAYAGWSPREPAGPTPVTSWRSGTFGRLGVRDVQPVTDTEGEPLWRDGRLLLTMTHAGPGFAATGHCGVWAMEPESFGLTPLSTLYFRRDGLVHGDHATHLVRDGDRWLVAASTWGDFDRSWVGITLAETAADLLSGEHVLDAAPVELPLAGLPHQTVAAWDPQLARIDGHWHLAFVAARKFWSFHPVLARASRPGALADFELVASADDRTGTEGPQLRRICGEWRLLASDGPDNPPELARRFPVFDLALREVGPLDAAYPTNIPWPSVVEHDGEWLMPTFDGTRYGGKLPGYGTHGDLLVLRARPAPAGDG
jgi:hypothetical protein